VLALLIVLAWYGWNVNGRLALIGLGIVAMGMAAMVLHEPALGTAVAIFVISSNVTAFLPTITSPFLGLAVFSILIRKLIARNLNFRVTPFFVCTLLFFTWEWMSKLWAPTDNPLTPLPLTTFVRDLLIIVAVSWTVETPRQLRLVIIAGVLGAIVSASLTIQSFYAFLASKEAAELAKRASEIRFAGTFVDPNMAALSVIPFVGLGIVLFRSRGPWLLRLLGVVALVVPLVAVALSLSRGGTITALILLLMMVWAERRRWLLFSMIGVVIVIVLSVVPVDVIGRIATIGQGSRDASIGQRADMFWGGLQMAWDHFPLGVGLGNYGNFAMDYCRTMDHGNVAHEAYIDTIAESGPVGLLLLLVMLASLIPELRVKKWRISPDDFDTNIGVAMAAIFVYIILALAHNSYQHYPLYFVIMSVMSMRSTIFSDSRLRHLSTSTLDTLPSSDEV
jgi:O-antigen ligase